MPTRIVLREPPPAAASEAEPDAAPRRRGIEDLDLNDAAAADDEDDDRYAENDGGDDPEDAGARRRADVDPPARRRRRPRPLHRALAPPSPPASPDRFSARDRLSRTDISASPRLVGYMYMVVAGAVCALSAMQFRRMGIPGVQTLPIGGLPETLPAAAATAVGGGGGGGGSGSGGGGDESGAPMVLTGDGDGDGPSRRRRRLQDDGSTSAPTAAAAVPSSAPTSTFPADAPQPAPTNATSAPSSSPSSSSPSATTASQFPTVAPKDDPSSIPSGAPLSVAPTTVAPTRLPTAAPSRPAVLGEISAAPMGVPAPAPSSAAPGASRSPSSSPAAATSSPTASHAPTSMSTSSPTSAAPSSPRPTPKSGFQVPEKVPGVTSSPTASPTSRPTQSALPSSALSAAPTTELRLEAVVEWKVWGAIAVPAFASFVGTVIIAVHFDKSFFPQTWKAVFRDGSTGERNVLLFLLAVWGAALYMCTSANSLGYIQANVFFSSWTGFLSVFLTYGLWRTGADKPSIVAQMRNHPRPTTYNWVWLGSFSFVLTLAIVDLWQEGHSASSLVGLKKESIARREWMLAVLVPACSTIVSVIAPLLSHCTARAGTPGWLRTTWHLTEGAMLLSLVGLWTYGLLHFTSVSGIVKDVNNPYVGVWGSFLSAVFAMGTWFRAGSAGLS